jgi:hypothetical protein
MSVLRLMSLPALAARVFDIAAPTFARLGDVTSRNICASSRCNKDIRMRNEKVKVGSKGKYDVLDGETMSNESMMQ